MTLLNTVPATRSVPLWLPPVLILGGFAIIMFYSNYKSIKNSDDNEVTDNPLALLSGAILSWVGLMLIASPVISDIPQLYPLYLLFLGSISEGAAITWFIHHRLLEEAEKGRSWADFMYAQIPRVLVGTFVIIVGGRTVTKLYLFSSGPRYVAYSTALVLTLGTLITSVIGMVRRLYPLKENVDLGCLFGFGICMVGVEIYNFISFSSKAIAFLISVFGITIGFVTFVPIYWQHKDEMAFIR